MCTQGSGGFCGAAWQAAALSIGPDAALAPDGGGSQPPRRLPACPTSRQRFHSHVVHPLVKLVALMPSRTLPADAASASAPPCNPGTLPTNRPSQSPSPPCNPGTQIGRAHV